MNKIIPFLNQKYFQHEIAAAPAAPVVSFAFQFTLSQAGIATRTLTLMQGSKEKKMYRLAIAPNPDSCQARLVGIEP